MKRREFMGLLGGAVAWPLAARVQQSAIPVIRFLSSLTPSDAPRIMAAFRLGLADTGYVEGRNEPSNTAGRRASSTGWEH